MKTTKQSETETENTQKQAVDRFTDRHRRLGLRSNQLYVRVKVSAGSGLWGGEWTYAPNNLENVVGIGLGEASG
jgi:hypothetical protein